MALTEVHICNLAQEKLGAEHITGSLSAPTGTAARRYSLIFPHYLSIELRKRRWRFALKKQQLALLTPNSADDDYPYRYALPNDCLRPLRDSSSDWIVRGIEILSAGSGTLKIEYISSAVPVAQFDPSFIDVLACRLALEANEKVTQSNTKGETLTRAYKEAVTVAAQANAFITGPEDIGADDSDFEWVAARG